MNILHIEVSGCIGGIEKQCYNELISSDNHYYFFIKKIGLFAEKSLEYGKSYAMYDENFKLKYKHVKPNIDYIQKIIKENNIDRIIVEHGAVISKIIALRLKKLGYHVYVYMHNSYYDNVDCGFIKRQLTDILFRKCLKKCDGVIAISKFVKQTILDCTHMNKYVGKIQIVYNGMILNDKVFVKDKPKNIVKFLYVGRVFSDKGITNTIECLKNLNIDYKFYIVGNGPDYEEYKNKYKKDNIIFCGEQEDVNKYYNECDIFVHLPNWDEGFGITLIEALNYGLPIISNYKGAIPEIIKDGYNGKLLKDYSEFNNAVTDILNNYSNYSKNAITESKKYSINNTLKGIESL